MTIPLTFPCPACGYRSESGDELGAPSPGAFTICPHCLSPLRIEKNMKLIAATSEELSALVEQRPATALLLHLLRRACYERRREQIANN